jgi:DNA (cytosine-5)-methyltransferase 1
VARGRKPTRKDQSNGAADYEHCVICNRDRAFLRRSVRPRYEEYRPVVRIVDLFCGCGGLSLGIAEAARRVGLGTKVSMAIDSDEDAVAVYRSNFPRADVRCVPVETVFDGHLSAKQTKSEEAARDKVGPVDVLIGGPPCQGSSDLNNHTRRDDPRNALYARMARAAWVLKPALVLVENVPSVRHDVEEVVDVTVRTLRRAGYEIHDAIIDLSGLGVPQHRRRHIVLASRDPRVDPRIVLESLTVRCDKHSARSVAWAISDLVKTNGHLFDTPSTPTPRNAKRIAYLFREDLYDLPNRLRPSCHHSVHSYRSMYGRLRWEEPAQTVTTGFGSMGQGRYVHPREPRMITPHEAARLQMLPDFVTFRDAPSRGAIAKMIGNCVPPALGIAIGELVLKTIAKRKRSARR